MNELLTKAENAKAASRLLGSVSTEIKNMALKKIAEALIIQENYLLEENSKDINNGLEAGIGTALIDRLRLSKERIKDMANGLKLVAELPDPISETIESWERPNGLKISKIRVPLGVIGMIYEARPNVTVDAAGLAIKTGNAAILRGSSTAINSNIALVKIIHDVLQQTEIPANSIQLIEDTKRDTVKQMIKLNDYIDVIIPRGGANLIQSVVKNASVPVLETGAGICHVFIDKEADLEMAKRITINSKTQRPSVCNAAETLLIERKWAESNLQSLIAVLEEQNVECRGCETTLTLIPHLKPATEEDWQTEYLDYILAVKVVEDIDEAIDHISKYGTKHSEVIVTNNEINAEKFLRFVDAAAVYHNASTRFTDGFEFGFGAEIGISTQKLHARGPMGLTALTSYKYVVKGTGQIR